MRRRVGLLLASAALTVLLAGTASAGYINNVTYDLTGSSMTTITGFGTNVDPVSGSLIVRYYAPGTTAPGPIGHGRLLAGDTFVTIGQTLPGLMTLTGSLDTTLLPPAPYGTPGAVAGDTLSFAPVADSWVTGFMHCTEVLTGICNLALGAPPTVPLPMTPTTPGPFPWVMPPMVFGAGTVGVGSFAATLTSVETTPSQVTVVFNYVGQEVASSGWTLIPEPGTFSLLALGLAGVAGVRSCMRWRMR